jgi:dTDP-4-dehydrorhamnose reductase
MRVLVTGGAGFLAGALARALAEAGHSVRSPTHQELDVTDRAAVQSGLLQVDAVVHTAYRPVSTAGVQAAWRVNVAGARTVAEAASRRGIRLVHLSSDVVFPGDGTWATEDDPPAPVTGFAYGEQKAAAESSVRAEAPTASVVRTSLLWDDEGGGSLAAMVQESADPDSRTRHFLDELRCPVHVEDVAGGIVRLLEDADPPPVLHLAGAEVVDRHLLAQSLAPSLGIAPAALRSARADSHPGPRPRDLRLDCRLARQRYRWSPRPLPAPG